MAAACNPGTRCTPAGGASSTSGTVTVQSILGNVPLPPGSTAFIPPPPGSAAAASWSPPLSKSVSPAVAGGVLVEGGGGIACNPQASCNGIVACPDGQSAYCDQGVCACHVPPQIYYGLYVSKEFTPCSRDVAYGAEQKAFLLYPGQAVSMTIDNAAAGFLDSTEVASNSILVVKVIPMVFGWNSSSDQAAWLVYDPSTPYQQWIDPYIVRIDETSVPDTQRVEFYVTDGLSVFVYAASGSSGSGDAPAGCLFASGLGATSVRRTANGSSACQAAQDFSSQVCNFKSSSSSASAAVAAPSAALRDTGGGSSGGGGGDSTRSQGLDPIVTFIIFGGVAAGVALLCWLLYLVVAHFSRRIGGYSSVASPMRPSRTRAIQPRAAYG